MEMTSSSNSKDHSFCFTLIAIILSILVLFTYLLVGHYNMEVYAIVSDSGPKPKTPIKHIIVISQGKRSFDNYFGTFPGANGIPANMSVPLNPFPQTFVKFSISVWFSTNNTLSKNGFLVNKGGLGVETPGKNMNYGIWMNTKGNIIGGFETRSGVDYKVGTNKTYNDGKWHNAIVTYDENSVLSLYLDGILVSKNQTTDAIPDADSDQRIRIGSNSLNLGNYFIGLIDEVRIWNRTLEYSEILNAFNNKHDTNGQQIYLSFNDSEKNESVNPASNSNFLSGIYLNGSSYYDVKNDSLQQAANVRPFHLEETKTSSPSVTSSAYKTSYNKGKMNGFIFAQTLNGNDPKLVMGHYDARELPYYWKFATEFVLADNFFAPSMGTGLANHQYLYTANFVEYQKNIQFRGFIDLNRTIFDELQDGGQSWKVYVKDYDPGLNYSNPDITQNRYVNLLAAIPRFVDNKTLNSNIVDLVQYYKDLRSDNFPAVSYIVAPHSDESSPRDISKGQEFVYSLALALMKSKHWSDSVFVITYQESGGWYDHVAPPLINGQPYGFRVPTLIISPFAKKGYIDSTFYDVTSILKFIEYNFGLPPLSTRDVKANNILNAFDFTQPPRKPPLLEPTSDQKSIQEASDIDAKNTESVDKVNLVYLIVLLLVPCVAFVIWVINKKRANLDSVQRTKTPT